MVARLAFLLATALLSACSDRKAKPEGQDIPINYPLQGYALIKAKQAADRGDSWGDKELAFHYGLTGDKSQSTVHFTRCLAALRPECLAEKANHLIADALDKRTTSAHRVGLLNEAMRYNAQATASNVPQTVRQRDGYLAQRRAIVELISGKARL